MNAKEARKRALEITGVKEREQYDSIKAVIENAVDEGKLNYSSSFHIMPAVRKKLDDEGYKIKTESHRNETYNIISW